MTPLIARLAVLISGSGSTMMNLAGAIERGELAARIEWVIASRPDAGGIERARSAGLRSEVIDRKAYPDTGTYSEALTRYLDAAGVDLVCMAGYLCFWHIPDRWLGRTLNIHPSLLPQFGGRGMHGMRVHEAVLRAGATVSGCTVHYADNQYDHGPIILQRTCPVLPADTPETLAKRVFQEEVQAYPAALAKAWGDILSRRGNVLPGTSQ
ncbi:MAG: phosphoribosylglycinamide formyltransferase [Phycisphaerae bacterium]